MKNIKKIPEAELEVMMVVWDAKKSVNSDYIMERLDKNWAKPTLLNLLSRLCDRGYLKCEKSGRINIYTAVVEKDDYLKRESASFLKRFYGNSLTGMVASLYDGNTISHEDLDELKEFIRQAEGDMHD